MIPCFKFGGNCQKESDTGFFIGARTHGSKSNGGTSISRNLFMWVMKRAPFTEESFPALPHTNADSSLVVAASKMSRYLNVEFNTREANSAHHDAANPSGKNATPSGIVQPEIQCEPPFFPFGQRTRTLRHSGSIRILRVAFGSLGERSSRSTDSRKIAFCAPRFTPDSTAFRLDIDFVQPDNDDGIRADLLSRAHRNQRKMFAIISSAELW